MTSIRKRMHFVLWSLLILFLLSMTIGGLVGGANILDKIFGKINPSEAIGIVNGEKISPDDFIRAVNLRVQQYRDGGQDPDERLMYSIRSEVWDNYIRDILIYKKIDEMDLVASNEEVVYYLKNNPPPFLLQEPSFQTDGVFDQEKYLQAVNNPVGNEWAQIENFMKETYIPNFKLQQTIASSVIITNEELKEEYIKSNIDYTVEGVHIVARKLLDEVPKPTEEEMYQYYVDHLDDYRKEETRAIRYVKWAKNPAGIDSSRVLDEALELIDKAKNGEDFSKLADLYSDDPGNQITPDSGRGGLLGWFGKGQMVPPFEEAAFSGKTNDIVGPVLSRFGYHVIKINDIRVNNDKKEVNASHILLNIKMGSQTRDLLRRKATRFSYDAQDYGFDAAIDTHKVEATEAQNLSVMDISIPGLGFMRDVVQFSFSDMSKIGSVSDRLENDQYFVVAVLDSMIPEGVQSFESVKNIIKGLVTIQKQKETAKMMANKVREKVDEKLSFTDIVSNDPRLELVAKDKKHLSQGFNSIGRSYKIIGALLESQVDDVIGPVETARGFAIIKLLNIAPFDSTEFENKSTEIYTKLLNKAQQDAFDNWLAELKDEAEIIDNRKYFY